VEEPLIIKSGLEEILKKSSEIMSKKGFHATSMRDLAKATNMSLAGLYHYFDSKDELIYLINLRGFSSLLGLAERIKLSKAAVDIKLYEFISMHINYFCKNRSNMRVMIFGTHGMDEDKHKKIRALKEDYQIIAREFVSAYIKEIKGENCSRKELDRKTYLLFGMMNWIFGWYSKKSHGTEEELVQDIYFTFTQGLCGYSKNLEGKTGYGTSKNH
jgi:AcrR family transcriptional regulator